MRSQKQQPNTKPDSPGNRKLKNMRHYSPVKKLLYSLILLILSAVLTNTVSAQAAGLDSSFDSDGIALTDVSTSDDEITATAIQADNKIVVVGYSEKPAQFTITRYNANGGLDTTFGVNGIVKTVFNGPSFARAVAIQSDGKIVVGGEAENKFALTRYTVSGSLDIGFGTQGKVLTVIDPASPGKISAVTGIAIQPDGKIIAAGYAEQSSLNFAVVRYTTSGSLDPSFDGDGRVTTDFADGSDQATAVKLQPDGKILVAGSADDEDLNTVFAVARYNAGGSLDTGFNGSGKVTTVTQCGAEALGIQADGKIVVTGSSDDIYLARYTANGTPDETFGKAGLVVTNIGGNSDNAYDLVIDSSGRILVTGSTVAKGNEDIIVARYLTSGSPDASFDGADGVIIVSAGSNSDLANSILLQSDGKIVVGGSQGLFGNKQFAVARLGPLTPTAGEATISGRVNFGTSRASQVRIGCTDSQGNTIYAVTDSAGYYSFYNQEVGQTYILSANHSAYTFTPSLIVVSLVGDYEDADFTVQ